MQEKVRKFSWLRVLLLIILGMIIFNLAMFIATGKLYEDLSSLGLFKLFSTVLIMSVAGLIITPAPIGLSLYALIMETLYVAGVLRNYWLFCLSASVIGVGIFMGVFIMLGSTKEWDLRQLIVMFVIHGLTAMVVYRGKWKIIEA